MLILGIETSCDETSAAIIQGNSDSKKVKLLSNIIASSLSLHSTTGGIIPENAAREQIKFIIPVVRESIEKANINIEDIDQIAVTYGPGLIGSLLVGVETAKALSLAWDKPLIPTNHLLGHIYANFIDEGQEDIEFPALSLIASGGHTDLVLIRKHKDYEWLGGTRDDAAGEAMDKIGRLLGLPYPGGPHIEKAALKGNENKYKFPQALIDSKDFDFSFSGLKTAVLREVQKESLTEQRVNDISASTQKAITDIIVRKTIKAAEKYNARSILLGGGVAANTKLRTDLQNGINKQNLNAKLFVPSKILCTDNGAMIAAAAFYNNEVTNFGNVDANPNLYFNVIE
jgi:N6-L-threonylcarbamoyladenine synthase